MSAGPGDAERLPWLEPYREPAPTRAGGSARRGGLVATGIAWASARRVTASVRTLQSGSGAIASGEYARRLPEAGPSA